MFSQELVHMYDSIHNPIIFDIVASITETWGITVNRMYKKKKNQET